MTDHDNTTIQVSNKWRSKVQEATGQATLTCNTQCKCLYRWYTSVPDVMTECFDKLKHRYSKTEVCQRTSQQK